MQFRTKVIFFIFFLASSLKAQDTSQEWFSGGDEGFYQYLSQKLFAYGHDRVTIGNLNGDLVTFEFTVSDSGYVGDVKVYQCTNINLCYQIRSILNTMGKVNPTIDSGKAIYSNRIYHMAVKRYFDGYQCQPAPTIR